MLIFIIQIHFKLILFVIEQRKENKLYKGRKILQIKKRQKKKVRVVNLTCSLFKHLATNQVFVFCMKKKKKKKLSFFVQGPSHCLEINPLPEPEPSRSALRLEDLSTDEEEARHGRINQYERKIDSLMTEVSSLKNEVSAREPHKALH